MSAASHPGGLEAAVRDEWHVVAASADLTCGAVRESALLGTPIAFERRSAGGIAVWRRTDGEPLPVIERFGYTWTTLGEPPHDMFTIPECAEADRRLVHAGTFAVHASAPRAIENFLDLGHFPFVHRAYLGIEPYTEVKDYEVEVTAGSRELVARRCRFYQPLPALTASEGFEVEYVYRVPHPYCSVLYKSCPVDAARSDVIALFARPVDAEHVVACLFLAMLDEAHSDLELRQFQQIIFAQDKPVLENQRPRRLPLDLRTETSVRADRSSVAYRRWLHERGVRYGTIPRGAPGTPSPPGGPGVSASWHAAPGGDGAHGGDGADDGNADVLQRWFPLCATEDLPPRHVLEVGLLGRELALWRSADGRPHVWENRCPHRGLRLTLGANLGDALRCAYHGYRFDAGTGRCTLIPAEPGRTPPARLRVATFPAFERAGLVWTRLTGTASDAERSRADGPPLPTDLAAAPATALYPIPLNVPAGRVIAALAHYRFRAAAALAVRESAAETCVTTVLDAWNVESIAGRDGAENRVRLHVRPVDPGCTVIHGVLFGELDAAIRGAALHHHAARLISVRRELEAVTAAAAASGI